MCRDVLISLKATQTIRIPKGRYVMKKTTITAAILLTIATLTATSALAEPAKQVTTCFLTADDHIYIALTDELFSVKQQASAVTGITTVAYAIGGTLVVVLIWVLSIIGLNIKSYDKIDWLVLFIITALSTLALSTGYQGSGELKAGASLINKLEAAIEGKSEPSLDILSMCSNEYGLKDSVISVVLDDSAETSRFEIRNLK